MTEIQQDDLTAIRTGAAIYPLTDRAFLRITGSDATRWLNGMVTNNTKDLAPGEGNYNFILNAQGRIQGDCTIYREPGDAEPTFLLETDALQLDTLNRLLDKFIIMDDVELTPALVDQPALLVLGPGAPQALDNLGLPAIEALHLAHAITRHGSVTILADSNLSFQLRAPIATLNALRSSLVISEVSAETVEQLRILSGIPKFGQDIRDRDLPQETAQTHALHFAKGCYLGQEIVERIRSRGQVHRTFIQFTLTGSLPELPAPLEANGRPVGELTSAAAIPGPDGDTIHALGYIRREAIVHPATYPGGTATPRQLTT